MRRTLPVVAFCPMNSTRLSHELRRSNAAFMKQRRAIVGLSALSIGIMSVIALYQTGVIKHLPNPPLPKFDAEKVNSSAEGYSRFDTPDAVLALGSYSATLALAAMGGKARARTRRWAPLALAAKAAFDAYQGVRLTLDQKLRQKAYCLGCLIVATASFAMLPLALPEARAALRQR